MTMQIRQIQVFQQILTSHETYYMAAGKTCDGTQSILLKLTLDDGTTGWGEVCPIPHYLPAYAEGVVPALQYLKPVLFEQPFAAPEQLMTQCDAWLMGHPYVKSALDTAMWDAFAKICQQPLYALLGGLQQTQLPLYHSITCIEPDAMATIAKKAMLEGIQQFQVKLGSDNNMAKDIQRLIRVRETVAAHHLVYGDWNMGVSTLEASRVGQAIAHLDIMLEQPCASIEECAQVRHATNLPMKQDETAHDTHSLLKAYQLGCMDVVAIKLSKFGGISKARQARDLCSQLGVRMCIEDTWGGDITTAAVLHLAASTPKKWLLNTCDLCSYVSPQLALNIPKRNKGHIQPPSGYGLGIAVDETLLNKPLITLRG